MYSSGIFSVYHMQSPPCKTTSRRNYCTQLSYPLVFSHMRSPPCKTISRRNYCTQRSYPLVFFSHRHEAVTSWLWSCYCFTHSRYPGAKTKQNHFLVMKRFGQYQLCPLSFCSLGFCYPTYWVQVSRLLEAKIILRMQLGFLPEWRGTRVTAWMHACMETFRSMWDRMGYLAQSERPW